MQIRIFENVIKTIERPQKIYLPNTHYGKDLYIFSYYVHFVQFCYSTFL